MPWFLKAFALALRLHAAVPTMSWHAAFEHASAAELASTPHVSPELLLAVAFVESRFDVTATSRVEGATRRTGHYAGTAPPSNLAPHASLFCGPLQTIAGSWRDCIALRRLPVAYAAGVSELETWLADRRVHGNVAAALAGHGCGNFGVITGRCNAYPARVLGMRRLFEPPAPTVQARVAPRS